MKTSEIKTTLLMLAGQAALISAATIGGAVFWAAGIPAPWLSGGMAAVAVLASTGRVPDMANGLRDLAMVVTGVAMGGAVTPEAIDTIGRYPLSLLMLTLCVIAIVMICGELLVRVADWRRLDAVLGSVPGALSSVLAVAASTGADVGRIATVQLVRLFALVAILPGLVALADGGPLGRSVTPLIATPAELTALFGAALAAGIIFERLRIVAPLLLGAMLASAGLHGSGLTSGQAPPLLADIGFLLLGIFIGSRFRGVSLRAIAANLKLSLGLLVVAMAVASAFSYATAKLTGLPFGLVLVAFAPGGVEAMTVLAFALGLDPLYVGAHHVARFVGIAVALAAAGRMGWGTPPRNPEVD